LCVGGVRVCVCACVDAHARQLGNIWIVQVQCSLENIHYLGV